MSVLIKGMEMPTNCQDCPLNYDQMACKVTGTRWWSDAIVLMNFDSEKERLYDCPLVDVNTPHGRLGDLDKLKYEIVVGNQKYLGLNEPCLEDVTPIENVDDCIDAIAFAPTVIEAEWSET